jgi:hypothetical protein
MTVVIPIGLIISLLVAIVTAIARSQRGSSGAARDFLAFLQAGDKAAARSALDRRYPAEREASGRSYVRLRQRFAGLALLADAAAIEAELAALTGPPEWTIPVELIAYLGLAINGRPEKAAVGAGKHSMQIMETWPWPEKVRPKQIDLVTPVNFLVMKLTGAKPRFLPREVLEASADGPLTLVLAKLALERAGE